MRSDPLTLQWKAGEREGTAVLSLTGPLTLNTLFSFQEEVANAKPQLLIIDLLNSPYMDSAGLGSLLNAYVSAEKRGCHVFIAGANERIRALLETTKVDTILKNFPDAAAAEASLPANK